MKCSPRYLASLAACAALSACAAWGPDAVKPGQSEADVIQTLGKPTHIYPDGDSRLLEYMQGPMGQTTYMARIGPDGRVVSYQQVLTSKTFASIKIGEATKDSVLRTVGTPSEVEFYPLSQLESWSYPYKENNAWDSMMAIYFDRSGVVRKLENGPDPSRDPDRRRMHRGRPFHR